MRWSETNSCFSQRPFAAVTMKTKRKNPNTYKYPDYLMHYGIKGQQWGLRRFQNEDGSLTEEGKLRYNEGKPESEEWRKNEAEHLTDAELRRRNNRLQMERQYRELTTSEIDREKAQFTKDIIKKALVIPVVAIAGILGKKYITSHSDKIAKVLSTAGKTLVTKMKSPVVRSLNQKNLAKQTLASTISRAASLYGGLNRPPIGNRQYYPLTPYAFLRFLRNR